ncbi:MAG: ATP-binding cassette domain-containing protein [Suipraeoptans sp.]
MSIVNMKGIYKKFGKFTALNNVNLELSEGEIFGFIGPNGAGKTTTLRILMGIIKASEGNAKIFGKDVWSDAVELHKRIAYVPGDVNLWSNLTGGEVIDLLVRLRKNGTKKYKEELIERFAFDPSKKCRTYSKGNKQKVALVAAFASDADLYILDEPTSGLDPLMEKVFRECVGEVKAKGKTVLLSSHILSEVEQLCDKVGIIRRGKIIETGTMEELRHLTRTEVKVITKSPLTELKDNAAIHDLKEDGGKTTFAIDANDMASVMNIIASKEIINLECAPPTLEELFMSHYEEGR